MDNQVNQTFGTVTQTAENKCSNCGVALTPGQAFCAVCGTPAPAPAPAPQANVCNNCGNEIQAGVAFCPNCGNNVSVAAPTPTAPSIYAYNQQVAKKKSNMPKIIIGAVAAVLVVVLAIVIIPMLQVTPEELMAEGNYVEAYEKADSSSEKDKILAENVIAVLSQESSDGLKDPSSFVLREGYYYPFLHDDGAIGSYAVLYIAGANSYGAKVSSYWAYTLGKDGEWNYIGSADVSYDESSDDLSDKLIKMIVRAGMEKGTKLSRDQVNRINDLFEADLLYTVDAIDWDDVDTSNFKQD